MPACAYCHDHTHECVCRPACMCPGHQLPPEGAAPVGSEARCTCTVTGPEYDDTTFDPACPYHGENGTMVARVAPKYCPVSEAPCEKGCRTILYCKRSAAGDHYAEALIQGQGTGHEQVIPTRSDAAVTRSQLAVDRLGLRSQPGEGSDAALIAKLREWMAMNDRHLVPPGSPWVNGYRTAVASLSAFLDEHEKGAEGS